MLLRALVLPREKAWRDHELVQQPQNNARVRYLVGLPLGTRALPFAHKEYLTYSAVAFMV